MTCPARRRIAKATKDSKTKKKAEWSLRHLLIILVILLIIGVAMGVALS